MLKSGIRMLLEVGSGVQPVCPEVCKTAVYGVYSEDPVRWVWSANCYPDGKIKRLL